MSRSRELYVLRHGKSDWTAGLPDFQRKLNERGRRSAQRVGTHLGVSGVSFDHVLSSPAERARGTAERVCKSLGATAAMVN